MTAITPDVAPPAERVTQRLLDVVVASSALVVLSPFLLLVGLVVRLDSPGPAFFRQVRVGRGGREFGLWKFRTMAVDAERTGPGLTVEGDRRVTRVGGALRRVKIDELPQLWNVLWGEMSLVGPRPEIPFYVDQYTTQQREVLAYRPGLTDPASLVYREEESILAAQPAPLDFYREVLMPEKVRLSLEYARSATLGSDLGVMLRTAAILLGLSAPPRGALGAPPSAEEDRIRRVYAERDREGARERYSDDRPVNPFWRARREQVAKELLAGSAIDLTHAECLDVGCGAGGWLVTLAAWGVREKALHGIDLLEDRVEAARRSLPTADLRVASGFALPYDDGSMDLVCANTVFSSILDPGARFALAREMVRVTRPGGLLMTYDFRVSHPRNPNTRAVGRAETERLFACRMVGSRSLTLAPPVARPLTRVSVTAARALESLAPFLRTHAMHLMQSPHDGPATRATSA